jgi:hypothetical protein
MANRQAFGRRINPQAVQRPQHLGVPPAAERGPAPEAPPETAPPVPDTAEDPSTDAELHAWKVARGSRFRMPWSQLSLVASLFFGVASFVLPDSVNDSVDWLLWGLSIVSFCVWFSNRRKKKLTSPAAP